MESNIQSKIIKHLKSRGAYVFKTIVTNRNGVPDVIFCLGGKFVAFEIKDAKNESTSLQEWNRKEIIKAGGHAFEIRTLEEAKVALKSIEIKH